MRSGDPEACGSRIEGRVQILRGLNKGDVVLACWRDFPAGQGREAG